MAILRCNNCNYLREVPNEHVGKTVKCPVCEHPAPIHDAVTLVKKVIEKYQLLLGKYQELDQPNTEADEDSALASPNIVSRDKVLDLHNTTAMTNSAQFKPIIDWFKNRHIEIDVNLQALDTQGFYDEVAVELGDNYDVLQPVLDKIKKAQRSDYLSLALNISNNNQKEIKTITEFCRNLYDYAFVAKYFYNKKDKRIHLTLQTAPSIINFFNGEWLEWYVFMKLVKVFYDKKGLFSCLRSFVVNFPNEDKHEIDIFFLINQRMPLFIECKSGEFRSMIEKYNKLRKRLNIDKTHFLVLVLGLNEEQTNGLTNMHDVTFVNETNFIEHITQLSS
ncbi:MAG: hypothetical protein Q7U98_06650 [Methylicorpusculum sp.]|uniref:hypothetical protein n=2 Tax=Methylicorpusculum sp. TaxID=2713644 RepID=UPI00272299A6|nr:hypothetical protein [Methylicorpusculum sp.]MDO8938820.1 hypothetical protein [Methylicorpusculum sp.]MDO9240129.1 hypothetical protein [Methylicorpusculum sp.]MDP2203270.1 hypothetical protein [Methylicorpusculum sp.]